MERRLLQHFLKSFKSLFHSYQQARCIVHIMHIWLALNGKIYAAGSFFSASRCRMNGTGFLHEQLNMTSWTHQANSSGDLDSLNDHYGCCLPSTDSVASF